MKRKGTAFAVLTVLVIAAAALYVGYIFGREYAADKPATTVTAEKDEGKEGGKGPSNGPTAHVKTAPASQTVIDRTVVAYGSVVASPEDVQMLSVPFESRVARVLVKAGQAVSAGAATVEVEPSPEALLSLQEAQSNLEAARQTMDQVRQLVEMKLATVQELSATQQAERLAKLRLENLQARGIAARKVEASQAGVIAKVDVQEGQIIPAGAPLVELLAHGRLVARLGVEAADLPMVKAGQKVRLTTVASGQTLSVEGQVRLISQKVNSATRLIDVYVSLPAESRLLLDAAVTGRIVLDSHAALTVPRSAVLIEEEKRVVFTVADGKARRHEIQTGLEQDGRMEVLTGDINPGQQVVVEGGYELEDGMTVEVEKDQ